MKRLAIALTIAALLSSVPLLAQGRPENPGGVCAAVVAALPLPDVVKDASLVLFGCGPGCPPDCGGGSGGF